MVDVASYQAAKLEKKEPGQMITESAPFSPEGQNYLVVAIARIRNGETAPNFLGAFATPEECKDYINKIREKGYVYYDIYWVKMNHFVSFPPPLFATDTVYHQKALNSFMKIHNDELELAEKNMDERVSRLKLENKIFEAKRQHEDAKVSKLAETPSSSSSPKKCKKSLRRKNKTQKVRDM
jgi:hypothetical protein